MAAKKQVSGSNELTDNFDFQLIGGLASPFDGYVSAIDATVAGPGVMIRGSQNTYKKLSGTIAARCGIKLRGAIDATITPVISSFEWQNSLGFTRPIRQQNGLLQVEFDPGSGLQWYTFLAGLPSNICSYVSWYDSLTLNKDLLLIVDGQQQIIMWAGGVGVIASAANTTGIIGEILNPNNITNANTDQFSSGGIGYVAGDVISVSGGNGDARLLVESVASGGVSAVSVGAGGSSYTVGDLVKVGTGTTQALLKVTSISGGAVNGLSIVTAGVGNSTGSNLATTNVLTSSSPSGLTVNINSIANTISTWTFNNNGSGYSISSAGAPAATNGGTGTGASVWIGGVLTGRITLEGTDTAPQNGFPGLPSPTAGINTFSGGSFLVNGVSYSYTSLGDANQSFIGTSDVSGLSIGEVAVSTVSITDTSPTSVDTDAQLESNFTNDAIAVVGNQVHLICYKSRLIHISSSLHYDHYELIDFRAPGDPDLITLDSLGRAVGAQKGNAVLFGSKGDSYLVTRTAAIYNQGVDFAALAYEKVDIAKEQSSDLSSPQGQDFITFIGDTILYLDDSNQLRQYGTVRNIVTPVYPILSLDIYGELKNVSFTGGQLRAVGEQSGETVYVVSPVTGNTYVYQIRQKIDPVGNVTAERLWQPPQLWNLSRIAVIAGITYGHSAANPQIYQLWDTLQWHDDSPAGSQPYKAAVRFAYRNDNRQKYFRFDKLFVEGYADVSSVFGGYIYREYQGSVGIDPYTINNPDPVSGQPYVMTTYQVPIGNGLGDVSLGDAPLGGGITIIEDEHDTVPKYRTIVGVSDNDDIFEYALEVNSYTLDSRWEVLAIGVNAVQSSQNPTDIMQLIS